MKQPVYFDLHCDTITSLCGNGGDLASNSGQLDLARGTQLDAWIQTYAIFIPDSERGAAAREYYQKNLEYFRCQMAANREAVFQVKSGGDIAGALAGNRAGAMLAVEGGAVLEGDPANVEPLSKDGVRMITLTWNGENELGSGHDTDHGLTDTGREVIREMERTGIIVDVSHLNDRGFRDVCKAAGRPFVATHSNARSVCGHRRNLPDDFIMEIIRRGGLIGLNFCRFFLSDDPEKAGLEDLLRHARHILELGGEDCLSIGSDYDGAPIPDPLDSVEKLPALRAFLLGSGMGEALTDKIMGGNAVRFFQGQEAARRGESYCSTSVPGINPAG